MDLFGLAVLIGVLLAIDRRYIRRPDRLGYQGKPDNTPDDAIVLLLLLGIIVTGFIIEALRIHVTHPSWEVWSFVGWALAKAFAGVDPGTAKILHKVTWWTHTLLSLGFIAYIPYSRLMHIITTPANHFMASLQAGGAHRADPGLRERRSPSAWASSRSSPGSRSSIPTPARAAGAARTAARPTSPGSPSRRRS